MNGEWRGQNWGRELMPAEACTVLLFPLYPYISIIICNIIIKSMITPHHHHHNHHLNWDIIITIVLMTINFPRVCTKLLRGSGKGASWLWGWCWRASWGWWRWWSSRCQKFPPGLCHHCLGQPKVNTVHHPTQSKRQSAAQGVLARKRKKRSPAHLYTSSPTAHQLTCTPAHQQLTNSSPAHVYANSQAAQPAAKSEH